MLRASSPASSTDDPLLLDESGTPNLTMQAAYGDAGLVSMVRGMEREDLANRATPDLYDRSIGVRKRISLIMSPNRGGQARESSASPVDDTTHDEDDTPQGLNDTPREMQHGLGEQPSASTTLLPHDSAHATPTAAHMKSPPASRPQSSRGAEKSMEKQTRPRYIDFHDDDDNERNAAGNESPGKLKFVWGGTPGRSISRTRKSVRKSEAARQAAIENTRRAADRDDEERAEEAARQAEEARQVAEEEAYLLEEEEAIRQAEEEAERQAEEASTPQSTWGIALKEEPATPISGRKAHIQHAGISPRFSRTRGSATPVSVRRSLRYTPRQYDDERDEFGPASERDLSYRRTDDPVLPSDGTLLDEWSMDASRLRSEHASRLSAMLEEDELADETAHAQSDVDDAASYQTESADSPTSSAEDLDASSDHADVSRAALSETLESSTDSLESTAALPAAEQSNSRDLEPDSILSWTHSHHSTPRRRKSTGASAKPPTRIPIVLEGTETSTNYAQGAAHAQHADTQSTSDHLDTSTELPEPPQVTPLERDELPHTLNIPRVSQLSPVQEVSEEVSTRSFGAHLRPATAAIPPRRVQRPHVRDVEDEAMLHTTPGRQLLLHESSRSRARQIPTRIPVPVRESAPVESQARPNESPTHWPPVNPIFQRFQRLPGEPSPHVASPASNEHRQTETVSEQQEASVEHAEPASPPSIVREPPVPDEEATTELPAGAEDSTAEQSEPHPAPAEHATTSSPLRGSPGGTPQRASNVQSALSPVKRQSATPLHRTALPSARPFASPQFAAELSSARKRKEPEPDAQPSAPMLTVAHTGDASASLSVEALSDLSASLSASSHERALMLTRARPTACVEVSSIDPFAAARAAAILKVHHQYIDEGWLAQRQTESTSLHGLLADAEQSLRHVAPATPAAQVPGTPWVPGAFTPRSARRARNGAPRIASHALRPQAQAGRWSQDAWVQLDMQLRGYLRECVDESADDAALRSAVLQVDADEVIMRFLDSQGLEPEDLTGDWTLTKLYARVPALQARLLRQLKVDAAEASALIERSLHQTDRRDVTFGSPFKRGAHSTPLSARMAPAPAEASVSMATTGENTIDASDKLYEGTELPPRKRMREDPDASIAARLWRGIWPWRKENAAAPQESTSAPTPRSHDDTRSVSHSDTTATWSRVPARTSFGGFGIGMGSSSVQSTAFSALGDDAQTQATVTAAQFARRRAARWESPQRARARRNAAIRANARRIGDTSTSLAVPSSFEESRKMWQEREHA
ncbi:hypothetical protein MCUN1_001935 [Malassezia cuniculi]|uniref:Uncharacterized protein n=1 Tax=Malassezia cuniculi TaxID=948313 RepID=A0AAF0JBA0_9BASI|nr:hypothetical protein MCUN1_001935 [Malassezia cuniculi]